GRRSLVGDFALERAPTGGGYLLGGDRGSAAFGRLFLAGFGGLGFGCRGVALIVGTAPGQRQEAGQGRCQANHYSETNTLHRETSVGNEDRVRGTFRSLGDFGGVARSERSEGREEASPAQNHALRCAQSVPPISRSSPCQCSDYFSAEPNSSLG